LEVYKSNLRPSGGNAGKAMQRCDGKFYQLSLIILPNGGIDGAGHLCSFSRKWLIYSNQFSTFEKTSFIRSALEKRYICCISTAKNDFFG
jgi:hypothetical protein